MLRAGEALLAISPLLAAALLYGIVYQRLPSRRVVALISVIEAVLAIALVWQGASEGLSPHERYVPARLNGGTVVEGHGG